MRILGAALLTGAAAGAAWALARMGAGTPLAGALGGAVLGRPLTRSEIRDEIAEVKRALTKLRRKQFCAPVACRVPTRRKDGTPSRRPCPSTFRTKTDAVEAIFDANPELAEWLEGLGEPSYRTWVARGRRGPKPFPGQRERGLDAFDVRWDLRGRQRVGTWAEALYRTLPSTRRWRDAVDRLAFFDTQAEDAGAPPVSPPVELARLVLADEAVRQCHEEAPTPAALRARLRRLRRRLPKAPHMTEVPF